MIYYWTPLNRLSQPPPPPSWWDQRGLSPLVHPADNGASLYDAQDQSNAIAHTCAIAHRWAISVWCTHPGTTLPFAADDPATFDRLLLNLAALTWAATPLGLDAVIFDLEYYPATPNQSGGLMRERLSYVPSMDWASIGKRVAQACAPAQVGGYVTPTERKRLRGLDAWFRGVATVTRPLFLGEDYNRPHPWPDHQHSYFTGYTQLNQAHHDPHDSWVWQGYSHPPFVLLP